MAPPPVGHEQRSRSRSAAERSSAGEAEAVANWQAAMARAERLAVPRSSSSSALDRWGAEEEHRGKRRPPARHTPQGSGRSPCRSQPGAGERRGATGQRNPNPRPRTPRRDIQ
uniref:Uncharacterized protein n=2 Tax=Calcidiscus leptoporus TaxID=127549 RepID=A0A7S0P4R9_9EUKA